MKVDLMGDLNINVCLNLASAFQKLKPPVLIVSTIVGRGMYSIGDAAKDLFDKTDEVYHVPVEELMNPKAYNEDFKRYQLISNRMPFLLNLVYKVPFFYYRKLLREKHFGSSDLHRIQGKMAELKINSVLCISHRPAFWLSAYKRRFNADFQLWGLLGEYGRTLGWKYIFWDVMDGYLSPLDEKEHDFPFPAHLDYINIELPVRRDFGELANSPGDKNKTLLVAGYWGQSSFSKIIDNLNRRFPKLHIHVVCGENKVAFERLNETYQTHPQVTVHGQLTSLAGLMKECASVISKPGISTVLETHHARRKLFLLKGMPVAEDHNADHAIQHFDAQWFTIDKFSKWYSSNYET